MLGFGIRGRTKSMDQKSVSKPAWSEGVAKSNSWDADVGSVDSFELESERYLRSDLVYIAINRIALMCAQQNRKLKLFNPQSPRNPKTGVPQEEILEHPFLDVWHQPNAWDSTFEFLEGTAINLLISGNAYWHLDDGSEALPTANNREQRVSLTGPPVAMWSVRPDRVKVVTDAKEYISAYKITVGDMSTLLDSKSIRHFKFYHPTQDFVGMSPMEPSNYASASDIQSQKSNFALYRNALRLSAVVESDMEEVDQEQVDLMEKYINERFTGDPEKSHQVAFLWSQFKMKELGMTMRDAEFVESSKMNRMRIFGVFGVHPAVVLSEDINLANALVGEYVTLKFTIAPMLQRIADDISPALGLWGGPPAEAHFVDVVPQDQDLLSKVALANAQAVQALVFSFGLEQGVAEAKRQGLVSQDVEISEVQAETERLLRGAANAQSTYP